MPTIGLLLLIGIGGLIIFGLDYFKKQKRIEDAAAGIDIKNNNLISDDCAELLENMKDKSKLKISGYYLVIPSGEKLCLLESAFKTDSRNLKFEPTDDEWKVIWKVIKKYN